MIKHYFAYGSNMNPLRAALRIPGALDIGRATLPGWRVVERLYADAVPARGRRIHGVLYRIAAEQLAALDHYEGYPAVYDRTVVTTLWRGRPVKAWTYFMTEPAVTNRTGLRYPEWYRILCRDGAMAHGISHNEFIRRDEPMKKNEPIRVAVYGTLLTGDANERIGADALDRKPCRMSGTLYDPNGGWYPAFVPDGTEAFNVAGEVLMVSAETFARLDRLEGYPNLYDRVRIPVLREDGTRVDAWVYVMRSLPQGAKVIDGGDWRTYRGNRAHR